MDAQEQLLAEKTERRALIEQNLGRVINEEVLTTWVHNETVGQLEALRRTSTVSREHAAREHAACASAAHLQQLEESARVNGLVEGVLDGGIIDRTRLRSIEVDKFELLVSAEAAAGNTERADRLRQQIFRESQASRSGLTANDEELMELISKGAMLARRDFADGKTSEGVLLLEHVAELYQKKDRIKKALPENHDDFVLRVAEAAETHSVWLMESLASSTHAARVEDRDEWEAAFARTTQLLSDVLFSSNGRVNPLVFDHSPTRNRIAAGVAGEILITLQMRNRFLNKALLISTLPSRFMGTHLGEPIEKEYEQAYHEYIEKSGIMTTDQDGALRPLDEIANNVAKHYEIDPILAQVDEVPLLQVIRVASEPGIFQSITIEGGKAPGKRHRPENIVIPGVISQAELLLRLGLRNYQMISSRENVNREFLSSAAEVSERLEFFDEFLTKPLKELGSFAGLRTLIDELNKAPESASRKIKKSFERELETAAKESDSVLENAEQLRMLVALADVKQVEQFTASVKQARVLMTYVSRLYGLHAEVDHKSFRLAIANIEQHPAANERTEFVRGTSRLNESSYAGHRERPILESIDYWAANLFANLFEMDIVNLRPEDIQQALTSRLTDHMRTAPSLQTMLNVMETLPAIIKKIDPLHSDTEIMQIKTGMVFNLLRTYGANPEITGASPVTRRILAYLTRKKVI